MQMKLLVKILFLKKLKPKKNKLLIYYLLLNVIATLNYVIQNNFPNILYIL